MKKILNRLTAPLSGRWLNAAVSLFAVAAVPFLSLPSQAEAARCQEQVAPYWKQGSFTDLGRVENIISQCIKADPADAEASYLAGVVAIQKNDYTAALKHFDDAIAKKPEYLKAYVNRADLHIVLKNTESGLNDYSKAIALSPWDPHLRLRRANVLMNKARFEEAILDYTAVLEVIPDFAEAYNFRSLAYAALNQKANMCADFEKLCELGFCMNLEKAVARKDCRP